jgi:hypothetical protein
VLTALTITGCSSLWDDVTSRDFKVKTLFVQPDPLDVLENSTDGDLRAKALRRLKEPIAHGGTQADQDKVMKIVTTAAITDKQPVCRLAAMQALGRFKDPRAPGVLTDAFYRANSFAPDTNATLQCQALKMLGETGSPTGQELLVKVVREPRSEGTEIERQNAMDIRLAAARALGNYKDAKAEATLFIVMRTEKDVGLRMCAYDALKSATGKRMPLESKDWETLPQLANVVIPETPATAPARTAVAEAKQPPAITPVSSGFVVPPAASIQAGGIQPISTSPSTGIQPIGLTQPTSPAPMTPVIPGLPVKP